MHPRNADRRAVLIRLLQPPRTKDDKSIIGQSAGQRCQLPPESPPELAFASQLLGADIGHPMDTFTRKYRVIDAIHGCLLRDLYS